MDEMLSLGYWIRRRRKALDLTQTELAHIVFCSLSTIKKIELDQRRPSRLMAERLADCLKIDGSVREAFLAVASSQLPFDRLSATVNSFLPKPGISNLSEFQPKTPFIGYKNEIEQIERLIHHDNFHLITLVGPGGIGKTRLAFETASNQIQNFPGGVYFISLSSIESTAYIPSAVLDALSIPKHAISNPKATLFEYIHNKSMLLVFDNFEHLLNGSDLILELIHAAPAVVILVTSRVALNLSMERVFEVKGMAIQPTLGNDPSLSDAVQLFIQTANRAGRDIELTNESIASMIRICRLVEGMPLAIEIAASWARLRSFPEIEEGIQNNLDFLTDRMVDAPERHQSIHAAFEFSWQILPPEEKGIFPILSIFRGGFSYDAINSIAGADRATLESLVSKSLVRRTTADRYEMHELLRRYSESKMEDPEKTNQYRNLHLRYYLQLAENSLSHDISSPVTPRFLHLERDIDNFRYALQMAVDNHIQELGLRLVSALGQFWNEYGNLPEGMSWLNKMLQIENGQFPALRARVLIQSAKIENNLGQFDEAIRSSGESLSLFKQLKDKQGTGQSLMIIGISRYLTGEYDRGIRMLNKSLIIFRELGDEKSQAEVLIRIADVNMRQGMFDQASIKWQQALSLSTKLEIKHYIGFSLGGLGDIMRQQGKYLEAFDLHSKSLLIHWKENHRLDLPFVIEALALDYVALGVMDQAVVLWGAAESMRDEIHSPLPPIYLHSYAPIIEKIRKRMGESEFFKNWQEGRNASAEQLIKKILNLNSAVV